MQLDYGWYSYNFSIRLLLHTHPNLWVFKNVHIFAFTYEAGGGGGYGLLDIISYTDHAHYQSKKCSGWIWLFEKKEEPVCMSVCGGGGGELKE